MSRGGMGQHIEIMQEKRTIPDFFPVFRKIREKFPRAEGLFWSFLIVATHAGVGTQARSRGTDRADGSRVRLSRAWPAPTGTSGTCGSVSRAWPAPTEGHRGLAAGAGRARDGIRGTVVGDHRPRRTPERQRLRSHAGAWERAKPWCARRTLPAIMRKRLFVRRVRRAHHLFAGHRPPRCHPSRPRLMGSRRGRSPDQIIEIPFLSRAWPAPTTAAVLVGGGPCPRWQERQGHWRPPATEGGAPPAGGVTKNVTRETTGDGGGHGHW